MQREGTVVDSGGGFAMGQQRPGRAAEGGLEGREERRLIAFRAGDSRAGSQVGRQAGRQEGRRRAGSSVSRLDRWQVREAQEWIGGSCRFRKGWIVEELAVV